MHLRSCITLVHKCETNSYGTHACARQPYSTRCQRYVHRIQYSLSAHVQFQWPWKLVWPKPDQLDRLLQPCSRSWKHGLHTDHSSTSFLHRPSSEHTPSITVVAHSDVLEPSVLWFLLSCMAHACINGKVLRSSWHHQLQCPRGVGPASWWINTWHPLN